LTTGAHNSEGRSRSAFDWFEIAATILLALATVATAWSGYQASRWNGEQAKDSARVNALRIESTKQAAFANSQQQVDVAVFMQWADAFALEQDDLAAFYEQRFRTEFQPAFDAWIATDPLENADAPLTPFAMEEYQLAARQEAEEAEIRAEEKAAEVRSDIQRAANYVLCVVLFAAALFFAGISTKLSVRALRTAVLVIGCIIFLGTVAWIATFPVSVSV
jgi:hypothetical protein